VIPCEPYTTTNLRRNHYQSLSRYHVIICMQFNSVLYMAVSCCSNMKKPNVIKCFTCIFVFSLAFYFIFPLGGVKERNGNFFAAIQTICGDLCDLNKEVTYYEGDFLGTVKAKVKQILYLNILFFLPILRWIALHFLAQTF
jgi:hypothetical protein